MTVYHNHNSCLLNEMEGDNRVRERENKKAKQMKQIKESGPKKEYDDASTREREREESGQNDGDSDL